MRNFNFVLLALVVLLIGSAPAYAVPITVAYTGDNIVGAFYQNGSTPVSLGVGPNANNWQIADTQILNLPADDYQLIFAVSNVGGASGNNPAAFLAEISGFAVGDLLTSVAWEFSVDDGLFTEPADFDTLTWSAATEYGNNGGANIWTTNLGNAVPGIDTSAEWIWSGSNFGQGANPNLWIRAKISTVPEPASIIVWSMLGLCFAGIGWRRRRKA